MLKSIGFEIKFYFIYKNQNCYTKQYISVGKSMKIIFSFFIYP